MNHHNATVTRFAEDRREEILELIWILREEGNVTLRDILKRSKDPQAEELLRDMETEGLIFVDREGDKAGFRDRGEKWGGEIIRRHRIAERLLSEVFEMEEKQVEDHACELEHTHVLGDAVVDSICTFLGHPPTCPHGKRIPKGECCRMFSLEVKPLVKPLTDLRIGEDAKIVFISSKYHARLDRLSSLGIIAGSIMRLLQKQPTYVIRIGETELALDKDLAKEIFIKKI